MGDRRRVADQIDLEAYGLKRADCRLSTGAGPFDDDIDLLEAVILGGLCRLGGRHLGGIGRRFAGTLEADVAAGGPGDEVTLLVTDADDRVVEGGEDMHHPVTDILLFFALASALDSLGQLRLPPCPPLLPGLLLVGHGPAGSFAGAGVRLRSLAAHRKALLVAKPAVAADLDEPFDAHRDLAAQVAFDEMIVLDLVTKLLNLVIGEILDARIGVDSRKSQDLPRRRNPDAKDIGQPVFDSLLARKFNTCDSSHTSLPPRSLTLLVARVLAADDPNHSVSPDNAAVLTHGLYGRFDLHNQSRSLRKNIDPYQPR